MRKIFILTVALLSPQAVWGRGLLENTGLEINAQMGVYTSYLWRGFKINEDLVQQVGLDFDYRGLSAGIWTNSDLTYNENVQSKEIDYYLQLRKDFGNFSFYTGHIYYIFPPWKSYTGEFFFGTAYDIISTPSVIWFRDYIDGKGNYYSLDLSFPFNLTEVMSMELLLETGFNDGLFINGTGGDISCGLTLNTLLYDGVDFIPSVNFVIPFGQMKDEEENSFCGSLELRYSF